jgi:hypothetical protein
VALVLRIDEEIGKRVTPERSTMPKPTAGRRRSWPSPADRSRTWRTWSHANGSSGNGEALFVPVWS